MSEPSISNLDANGLQRYLGSTSVAMVSDGSEKMYENKFDSQIFNQKLCYQAGIWYHVTDQAMAVFKEIAPNDSIFMRGVVGWFEGDRYKTFTYLEKTNERVKGNLDVTNASMEKPDDLLSAFRMWKNIIQAGKQISIRLPMGLRENEDGVNEGNYASLVSQMVNAVHNSIPKYWTSSIEDDVFENWAKSEDSQEKYFSSEKNAVDLFMKNKKAIWSTWMGCAAKGEMPIPHIRTITTEK
jgi:hypothetical protein